MSKADLLLKKAASFEKLALYSDRKAFLQAVAQTYGDPNASVDPTTFSNKEVEQWDSQKQPKPGIPTPPDAGSPMTAPPGMNAQAPREQQKAAPPSQFNPQVKQLQQLLGFSADKADGKLGPYTQSAVNAYKQRIGKSQMSIPEMITQLNKDHAEMSQGGYSNIGQQGPTQPR
jgi:hypothetical protein